MSSDHKDPQRWSALAVDETMAATIGDGLRRARNESAMVSSAGVARIRTRLRNQFHPPRQTRYRWAWTTCAVVLLLSAGVASAVMTVRQWRQQPTPQIMPSRLNPIDAQRSTLLSPRAQAPQNASATVAGSMARDENVDREVSLPKQHRPKPRNLNARHASAAALALARNNPVATFVAPVLPLSSNSPDAQEGELLGDVVRALRRDRNPRLALTRLEEYEARFAATGTFVREATLVRIEAHLALAEHDKALAILEPLSISTLPRPRPIYLLRADLRASRGRCPEAVADFQAALAGASDATAERALRGRAVCREHLGDHGGARSDLRLHLELFPAHPQGLWLQQKLGSP